MVYMEGGVGDVGCKEGEEEAEVYKSSHGRSDRKGLMTIDDVTSAVMIVNVIRDKCKSYFNHPASKNPDPDPANN